MFGIYSYHGTIRKYAQIFAALFNDISVQRRNKETKEVEQVLTVPLGYGPRAQWIQRSLDRKLEQKVAITLPRMGFEMRGMGRDASRAIVPIQVNAADSSDREQRFRQFAQIPYNFSFELSVLTNDEDDAWQILEQILPYFQPDMSFNTNLIPEMKYSHEVTFTLDNLQLDQPYEGDIGERRIVSWSMTFTARGYLYGPVDKQGVIKKSIVDLRIPTGVLTISDEDLFAPPAERYTVRGGLTADGKPTFDEGQSIPYNRIRSTDDWAFIEKWERLIDGSTVEYGTSRPTAGGSPVVVLSPLSPVAQALEGAALAVQYKSIDADGELEINPRDGAYCILTLNANVTRLVVSNWFSGDIFGKLTLEVRNNGNFNIQNWGAVEWTDGAPPSVTPGIGVKDVFLLHTADSGVTVLGDVVGKGYRRIT